jgi:hypothetical protein
MFTNAGESTHPQRPTRPSVRFPRSAALDSLVAARTNIAATILLGIAFALLWPYRHFSGDDAYITFRFARNLASGHGFAFNPDVPTYGSTAPLWVFLIAGVHRLGLDVPDAAHCLNWLLSAANVVLFFRLAIAYLGRTAFAAVAALLLIVDPWFIRWSLSGMENALALLLLMGFLISQQQARNSGRISWIAPIIAALAALCRPEMAMLPGMLLLDVALFERRKRTVNICFALLSYALVLIPWIWYAHYNLGTIIPNTVTAKISGDHLMAFIRSLLYLATFWPFQALAVAAVPLIGSVRATHSDGDPKHRAMWLLPAAWALALPVFYTLGGAPVAGRYMMFGLPCYLLIGVKAWQILSVRFPRLIVSSIVGTLLLVGWVQYRYCWYVTRWPQGMDPKMIELATTLKRVSGDSDIVAADQIGVLGYYSNRYVLDTLGLVSPETIPYRKVPGDSAIWHYVRSRNVQYLFVSQNRDQLARLDPAYSSVTLVAQGDVQREGAGAVESGTIRYYLYRTNWAD